MKKLIILSGKAQCGKDTISTKIKTIVNKRGQTAISLAYADLLKYTLKKYYGWDGLKDHKGRTLLQYVGTEEWRNMDENVWVNYIMNVIESVKDRNDYIIITDARFQNEIDIPISIYGDKVLACRIIREGHEEIKESDHISEHNDELKGLVNIINKPNFPEKAAQEILDLIK